MDSFEEIRERRKKMLERRESIVFRMLQYNRFNTYLEN